MLNIPMSNTAEAVILKGPVAQHLCIEAAVVGVIDLFGHQSIESWAYGMRQFVQLNVERDRRRLGNANPRVSASYRQQRYLRKNLPYLQGFTREISRSRAHNQPFIFCFRLVAGQAGWGNAYSTIKSHLKNGIFVCSLRQEKFPPKYSRITPGLAIPNPGVEKKLHL